MSLFNRALQKELLKLAAQTYPSYCRYELGNIDDFCGKYPEISNSDRDQLWREVNYLRDHNLIIMDSACSINPGPVGVYGYIKATESGIDFILEDGGLSAILNVKTVKFHRDAVIALEDLIALSALGESEKEKAKSKLAELPTEALKTVVQTVTTAGLRALFP